MALLRIVLAVVAFGIAFAGLARAETFQEEAATTISSNPSLAAERSRVRAVRQALPLAWSEILPQITVDARAVEQNSTETPAGPTIRERPEYWLASVRTSTMLFSSGRVMASTRQARAQIASAVARYQDAVQQVTLEFTEAYADVIFAKNAYEAQQESLAILEEQLRFARANLREGFLTRTDVAQAEARVALARAELSRAQSRVVQANEAYARVVGHLPQGLEAPPAVEGLPDSLDAALSLAEDEHPRLVAAHADAIAADAGVSVAASAGRARVFVETTNSAFDVIDGPPAYDQESDSNVAVRVSVPLFSGGSVGLRTRQQRYLRDASRYLLVDVQRRVRERVIVSWSNLSAVRARMEAARTRLEAAELASRGVRREQEFGQRSMIDVLNQEQERLNASVGVSEAERDLAIAERELAAAAGQITPLLGLEEEANPRRYTRPPRPARRD